MAMASSAFAVFFSARPAVAVTGHPRAASAFVHVEAATEGGKWWAPLVGWSGRADYIESAALAALVVEEEAKRPFVGGLTEEKAQQLWARIVETESFRNTMYHSAITSLLARSSA